MTAPEPSLADIERLRRHHDGGLSVMRGWEAFGVAPRGRGYAGHDDPIVRRLGTSSVHPDVPAGAVEDWPAPRAARRHRRLHRLVLRRRPRWRLRQGVGTQP